MNLDHVFVYSQQFRGNLKSVAAFRTDRKGRGIAAFYSLIAPKREKESSEFPSRTRAIELMGYELGLTSEPVVAVSTNIQYDAELFQPSFGNASIWLDVRQLAWPLVLHTAVSQHRSFSELCAHFGITKEIDERAGTSECVALSQLYWAMMTRYKTSLFGEEALRNAGGKTLASVRKLIGF